MGTLKQPKKIYFIRFSDDTDEPMCFTSYSDMKMFMEEAVFEGDTIDFWKIYSCNADEYTHPKATISVTVPE